MSAIRPFDVRLKPVVKVLLAFGSLLMCFLVYKISEEGGIAVAKESLWQGRLFEAFALLMCPAAFTYASQTLRVQPPVIRITRFLGLSRRTYLEGNLYRADLIPANGNAGDRLKLHFQDGYTFTVRRLDTTNWDQLVLYLESRNVVFW